MQHDLKQQKAWLEENRIKKKGLSVSVRLKNGKPDIDAALGILKKRVDDENVLKDARTHEFYQSKGQLRRQAQKDAKRRHQKILRDKDRLEA